MSTKKTEIFKNGIWLKEQQGVLTVGSLDKNNTDVMVLSEEITAKLHAFEEDMIEALYGENRESFRPGVLDIQHLFKQLKQRFGDVQMNLSFDKSDERPFVCDFDPVFSLLEKLILSSTYNGSNPVIHISASLVQDHLCIIYRDSESISNPSALEPEFFLIKNRLAGDVQFKKADKKGGYYDIMIPSADC